MQEHEFYFDHYQNKMKTNFLITHDKVDFYFTNASYYSSALFYTFQLDLKEYPIKASFAYFSVVGKVFQNSSSRYEQLVNWFRGMKHLTQVEFHKTDFYRNVYRLIDYILLWVKGFKDNYYRVPKTLEFFVEKEPRGFDL
jgi:hypothetical protein